MLKPEYQLEQQELFKQLETAAEIVPCLYYWLDLDGRLVGLNSMCVKAMQIPGRESILGKNTHEFYSNSKEVADAIREDIEQVLKTGQVSQCIDRTVDSNGVVKYFMATRSPLMSKDGTTVIGLVGTSIEIDEFCANNMTYKKFGF